MAAGGSGFADICSAMEELDPHYDGNGTVGACRLCGNSSQFSFNVLKGGSTGCRLSQAIAAFGFLNGIFCKSPVPTLQRKTPKLLF
jgi:hypothetical protein